jgi:hypothetical protein
MSSAIDSYLAVDPLQAVSIHLHENVARGLLHARLHRGRLSVDTPVVKNDE